MAKLIDTTTLNYYKSKSDQKYVNKADVDQSLNEASWWIKWTGTKVWR